MPTAIARLKSRTAATPGKGCRTGWEQDAEGGAALSKPHELLLQPVHVREATAAREKQAEPPSVGVVRSGHFKPQEMIVGKVSTPKRRNLAIGRRRGARTGNGRGGGGQVGMLSFRTRQRSGETRRGRTSQDRRRSYRALFIPLLRSDGMQQQRRRHAHVSPGSARTALTKEGRYFCPSRAGACFASFRTSFPPLRSSSVRQLTPSRFPTTTGLRSTYVRRYVQALQYSTYLRTVTHSFVLSSARPCPMTSSIKGPRAGAPPSEAASVSPLSCVVTSQAWYRRLGIERQLGRSASGVEPTR